MWFGWLSTILLPAGPKIHLEAVCVRFKDENKTETLRIRVLRYLQVSILTPTSHTHLFIEHWGYIILSLDVVVKQHAQQPNSKQITKINPNWPYGGWFAKRLGVGALRCRAPCASQRGSSATGKLFKTSEYVVKSGKFCGGKADWTEMDCESSLMKQLWFINQPLPQHISGTIMPIFRIARPYITAYGFQHVMWWLESWEAGRQVVYTV